MHPPSAHPKEAPSILFYPPWQSPCTSFLPSVKKPLQLHSGFSLVCPPRINLCNSSALFIVREEDSVVFLAVPLQLPLHSLKKPLHLLYALQLHQPSLMEAFQLSCSPLISFFLPSLEKPILLSLYTLKRPLQILSALQAPATPLCTL
jgi:hypothetical protein